MTFLTKKRLFIIICSLLSVLGISWFGLYLQRAHHIIGGGINRASLFLLINIHVGAIIVLLFLITRHSIKLFIERQQTKPGSIFKRNLLFAFILFSVIPSLFVFFTAGKFITKSIDYWFSARIHTGLTESLQLHALYTQHERTMLENFGTNALRYLENLAIDFSHETDLSVLLDNAQIQIPDNVNVYVWPLESKTLRQSIYQEVEVWRDYRTLNDRTMKSLKLCFCKKLKKLHSSAEIFDFYGSLYWAKKVGSHVIVFVYRYPSTIRKTLIKIQNSYEDYEHLKAMHNLIYLNYLSSFILITLLILFMSIWCAFYLARGISKPLQDLLEATSQLSKGIWGVQVHNQTNNDLQALIVEFNNMTEALQKARDHIEKKNNELLMILENITSSVFLINRFGKILTYNPASKRLINEILLSADIKNKKVSIFPESLRLPFFTLIKELIHSDKKQLIKEVRPRINGAQRVLVVQVTRLTFHTKIDQKHENAILIVIEDLTNIVKDSQIKTWQSAARQMAHEIKNPLTPIQLATQRLQRKYKEALWHDDAFMGCTNTILNQVKIIKDLASHFSEFASMPAVQIEAVNINEIIQELLFLYQTSYPDITFELNLHEPMPIIKSDAKKLKRVFVNLLDNSVRALQCNTNKLIAITTSLQSKSHKLIIIFSDNGPGMPSSVKEQLFLPHVSTEKKNMGLGLAIIHDIITHQLQGSIELVHSRVGTTFKILLSL